ncbi:hypothetical protein PMAYCL1PPCAC_10858, partial [Pristionchus mayeri]
FSQEVTALLYPPQAGYVTAALIAIGVPLTAFCFTISWSAAVLPTNLMFHAHNLLTTTLQMNLSVEAKPKFKPRIFAVIFVALTLIAAMASALSIYLFLSHFVTALAVIATITCACFVIDMECINALR